MVEPIYIWIPIHLVVMNWRKYFLIWWKMDIR